MLSLMSKHDAIHKLELYNTQFCTVVTGGSSYGYR